MNPIKLIKKSLLNKKSKRLNEKGDAAWRSGNLYSAEQFFRTSIEINRKNAKAYSNLGSVLIEQHRYDEGMMALEFSAKIAPEDPGVLVNLGNAYYRSGQAGKATEYYLAALTIDPENIPALSNSLRTLMDSCRWNILEKHTSSILERLDQGDEDALISISPFNSFFLPLNRKHQLDIAKYSANQWELLSPKINKNWNSKEKNERIRVAYLSSDFHDHATAHLSRRLYGLHDRSKFEIYGYSIGYPDNSDYRKNIENGCDVFRDFHDFDSEKISQIISRDKIDILVDLKGYTGGSRPAILANRPAPIQVNYLGYPGTMGASFIDYMISDKIVTPVCHQLDYSEEIVRLPDSYQITDNHQKINDESLTKNQLGLPDNKFIFCSFNVAAKIDRRTFSAWLRILSAVPDSVLWLMKLSDEAVRNLNEAAEASGISSTRLIYATPISKPKHLARLRHADLMLDTFTCNAHTTATDALWAEIPIVTLIGETFASRVAASLASSSGLKDLVANTEDSYCKIAIDLARNKELHTKFKRILSEKVMLPLFQTEKYVKNLEDAYLEMVDRSVNTTRLV